MCVSQQRDWEHPRARWVKVQADLAHCAFRMLPFFPYKLRFMVTLDQAALLVAFLIVFAHFVSVLHFGILTKKSSSFSL